MTSKLNINWLNKCRCGNRMHTVETVRGSHVRLFEDDAVKCNACGREGVIQTCDGIATVLWETDEERAEGVTMTKSTIPRKQLIKKAQEQIEFCRHTKITGEGRAHVNQCAALFEIALAAMDSEPHTDDELSNLLWYSQESTCHSDPNYYCEFQRLATPGLIAGIIRELQERRKADSEPVAWTDEEELRDVNVAGIGYLFGIDREANKFADPRRQIMLYRHAQPAPVVPVVPDFKKLARELVDNLVDCGGLDEGVKEKYLEWAEKTCRATMLAAAPQEVK